MSRKVYRISIVLHALLMLSAGPVLADAPSTARPGDDQWIPSLSVILGFTNTKVDGTVETCEASFFVCNPSISRPADQSQNKLNSITVGGTLQIETPTLPIPHLRPRLFFEGEISHVSSQRRSIAKEGDPSTVLTEPAGSVFPDSAILGQGSETDVDEKNIQYGAVAGISIPVDIGEWRLSIKPSARYLRKKLYFRGIVSNGDRPGVLAQPPPTAVLLLQDETSLDVDAVGPGLEIELAAAEVGSLAASVYVSGGAYRILSDRSVDMQADGFDSEGNIRYFSDWSADIEPWIYRASVGMRIRWIGGRSGWFFLGD